MIRTFRQRTIGVGNYPLEVFHRTLLDQFDLFFVIGTDQEGINVHMLGELGDKFIAKPGQNVDHSTWDVRTVKDLRQRNGTEGSGVRGKDHAGVPARQDGGNDRAQPQQATLLRGYCPVDSGIEKLKCGVETGFTLENRD